MCDVLRELFSDVLREREEKGVAEGMVEGEVKLVAIIRKKLQKGRDLAAITNELELEQEYVANVIELITGSPERTDIEAAKIIVGSR